MLCLTRRSITTKTSRPTRPRTSPKLCLLGMERFLPQAHPPGDTRRLRSLRRRGLLRWRKPGSLLSLTRFEPWKEIPMSVDTIIHNAKIATNGVPSFVEAIAITGGKISAVGKDEEILSLRVPGTQVINGERRTVIPGLNDSHMHPIRGGLNYNMELRWDGVPSLADALRMLKRQGTRTPPPQWIRVVGGWNEFQFAERRMPTLDEINAAAPDTPVFVLHLYDRALLNRAALRAVGYTKDTPAPPGGEIQRDKQGNPTGLLIARPNAGILYATLAKGPKLPVEQQMNSTRHFMRELNRLGLTSAIDAGDGSQNYPEDYQVIEELH